MKRIIYFLILYLFALPVTGYCQAELPPPPAYECQYAGEQITVDGYMNEPAWEKAPRTERFADITNGKELKYETWVKMLWNNEGIYIAYYIQEEDIWGTITRRDAFSYYDNDVEVFFDPNGDGLDYYEVEMTALNQIYDIHWNTRLTWGKEALTTPPGIWDINFDFAGLEHAMQYEGTLNWPKDKDKYWTVELFFPWYSFSQYAGMPLPPNPGDTWRIDFYRGQYDDRSNTSGDSYSWSVHGRVQMHIPERFGFVKFVR